MKAAIVYQPGNEGVFRYADVPDPECGADEVRVRIRAAAINRGELFQRAGVSAGIRPSKSAAGRRWPHIIGWDIAGEIESLGSNVKNRKIGERVVALLVQGGGYAELATVPSEMAVPIPDNVSFDDAAALPVAYLTAWYGLVRYAHLHAGEVALIQAGTSGVGVGGIQFAKNLGATVIATAGTDNKVELCVELGADHVINYTEQDFVDEVMRTTDGEGVAVVLECVGGETLTRSFDVLARHGRLVRVGNASFSESPKVDVATLFRVSPRLDAFSVV
jgi:NADPH:quinone reductase-like Zn-dependent oxidoreductase